MKKPNSKGMVVGNMVLWVFAALLYPLAHWVPTGSGVPPKIFELLIPVIVILMGFASTSFLRVAFKGGNGE